MMIVSQAVFNLLKPMPPFICPLRDANREGWKWQTRRVMNPQPIKPEVWLGENDWESELRNGLLNNCKYGKPGDLRYMREPLFKGPRDQVYYYDDESLVLSALTGEPIQWKWKKDVLSQLYMPKEAARTFKKYKIIRIEKLNEITGEDAMAEDIKLTATGLFETELPDDHHAGYVRTNKAQGTYRVLWDALNSDRGFGWCTNPWVWVIEYWDYEVHHEA